MIRLAPKPLAEKCLFCPSRGCYGQKRHFSARGLGAKRIIGSGSTICKEAETILKYNFGLISHVIITCAF